MESVQFTVEIILTLKHIATRDAASETWKVKKHGLNLTGIKSRLQGVISIFGLDHEFVISKWPKIKGRITHQNESFSQCSHD